MHENRKSLESIVHPSRIPIARWPSEPHFNLSTMQQVAVNSILSQSSTFDTVNGPPGTGKTTLLKDIFAELLFKRAKAMTTFKHPKEAFSSLGFQINVNEQFKYTPYKVDPSVSSYSMVVASSNNGAVENLSKDLPELKEVIRAHNENEKLSNEHRNFENNLYKLAEDVDYFRNVASVLKYDKSDLTKEEMESTWGLFSVALGKSKNNEKFENKFWFLSDDKNNRFRDHFNHSYTAEDWKQAKEELIEIEEQIESKKRDLCLLADELKKEDERNSKLIEIEQQITVATIQKNKLINDQMTIEKESERLKLLLKDWPKPGIFAWFTKKGAYPKEKIINISTPTQDTAKTFI